MASTKEPWFIMERSEALAGLLLTSRADVSVQKEYPRDDGVDFLVAINTGEPLATRLFVAQVKGTTSADPNDWMRTVNPLFQGNGQRASLPACVFVVNVRDNNAWYAWLAEPTVEPNGATLVFRQDGAFRRLDASAVAEIVDRVNVWYEALPKQFLPA